MISKAPVLTVDGPGGSGKGTLCRRLCQLLDWHLLDSGAIYRAFAIAAHARGLAEHQRGALVELAAGLDVRFETDQRGEPLVLVDGQDVTQELRNETTGNLASILAALPEVRAALLDRQRSFRKPPGLVADGRDMGTVVFPDATLKIFLTASPLERAQRRHKQLKEQGVNGNLSTLLREIAERDQRDKTREVAPLVPAHDAEIVDTTGLGIDQVVDRVMQLVKQKLGPDCTV